MELVSVPLFLYPRQLLILKM